LLIAKHTPIASQSDLSNLSLSFDLRGLIPSHSPSCFIFIPGECRVVVVVVDCSRTIYASYAYRKFGVKDLQNAAIAKGRRKEGWKEV
jgi:hypothetical protein